MTDNKGNNEDSSSSSKKKPEVSEAQKELAQNALNEFNKNNYGATLFNINKLLASRPKDIKVQLNKAVAEYFKSNLKKTDAFMKSLLDICFQANVKIDKVQPTDDKDINVVRLNYCTVLFHKMQYRYITAILEKMYESSDSLDEGVSISLCLLLIECYLKMSKPVKAFNLVMKTEAVFLPSPLPSQITVKTLPNETDSKSPEKDFDKEIGEAVSSNPILANTTAILPAEEPIGPEIRGTAYQESLREKLKLLRMRALLDMRLVSVAEREIGAVISHAAASGTTDNLTLIMIQSALEYLNGSKKPCLGILNKCGSINPSDTFYPRMPSVYYNNLAALHMTMNRPMSACIYMKKAKDELISLSKPKEKPELVALHSIGSSICTSIHYNLGLTLLKTGEPEVAFDCLIDAAQIHSGNPRVWLRLAECCICFHKMNKKSQVKESGSIHSNVIRGKRPILQLHPGLNYDKHLSEQLSSTEAAFPIPRLEFARLCLRNCMMLLPSEIPVCKPSMEHYKSEYIPQLYEASPSIPMPSTHLFEVKAHCLLSSAFISLCLGDYDVALKDCSELLELTLEQPQQTSVYRYLANIYTADAHIKLNRPAAALKHLSLEENEYMNEQDVYEFLTSGKGDTLELPPKMILDYNLTVAFALNRQYSQAFMLYQQMLSDLQNSSTPAHVYALGFYITKKIGRSDLADLMLLKHLTAKKII